MLIFVETSCGRARCDCADAGAGIDAGWCQLYREAERPTIGAEGTPSEFEEDASVIDCRWGGAAWLERRVTGLSTSVLKKKEDLGPYV